MYAVTGLWVSLQPEYLTKHTKPNNNNNNILFTIRKPLPQAKGKPDTFIIKPNHVYKTTEILLKEIHGYIKQGLGNIYKNKSLR